MSGTEAGKRAAAEAAAALVQDGTRIGLGSGSTMRIVLEVLARRVRDERLNIVGIPTSTEIEALALKLGLTLAEADATPIDLDIDGADEIETGTLSLIKGLGGALLREKIVAGASRRFVVVADSSKIVTTLGSRSPLPVEVTRFGHTATARQLDELGGKPVLRMEADGKPTITDGGNFVYDCGGFAPILDPFTLERSLHAIPGVMATGLFLQLAKEALVGAPDGTVTSLRRA